MWVEIKKCNVNTKLQTYASIQLEMSDGFDYV